jgi:hypothetical protein
MLANMRHHGLRPAGVSVCSSETVKVLTQSIIRILVFRAPHPPFVLHRSRSLTIFDDRFAVGRRLTDLLNSRESPRLD